MEAGDLLDSVKNKYFELCENYEYDKIKVRN